MESRGAESLTPAVLGDEGVRRRASRSLLGMLTRWILPFLIGGAPALAVADDLVSTGSVWRYLAGRTEPSAQEGAWRQLGFDASSWAEGIAPFRYGDGAGGTVLGDMRGDYSTLYLIQEFEVVSLEEIDELRLLVDYDDGFIAWLNGVEVERANAPTFPSHGSFAPSGHESGEIETFLIDRARDALQVGRNVIAVQVFNVTLDSSDLMLDLRIENARLTSNPRFSLHHGLFTEPFEVEIWVLTPGVMIRYTLDGTEPSQSHGAVYSTPIGISTTTVLRARAFREGFEPSTIGTQTYIFLTDVLRQPSLPAGYPESWGDASADYEMDPEIVNDPRTRDEMIHALTAIPTLSIVMDPDEMFGEDGIYHNGGSGANDDWERAASVEMIHPDGRPGFQIDCGIRPHSHVAGPRKRSFKLLFKSEYGDSKLRYSFFETAPLNSSSAASKFDRLILRAGLNRCWVNQWNPADTCYTRDQWARDSQIAMSGLGSHGTFVHLYINGLYWGVYNPCERPDAWFTSEYLGGDQEDWYAVNHAGSVSGDASRYDRLRQLVNEGLLDQEENYDEAREVLDVSRFCDYLILNWYAGTGDWPGNNWYGGVQNVPAGSFRYFCWDAEDIFDDLGSNRPGRSNDGAWVHPSFRRNSTSSSTIARVWRALRANGDFLMLFADRVSRHCHQEGALTEERSRNRWWTLNNFIQSAILAESARWGDARESLGDPVRTREEDWAPEVQRVSDVSLAGNVERLIAALRAEGYYPELDPPLIDPGGGLVPPDSRIEVLNLNVTGTVYYTLNGSDPREPRTAMVSVGAAEYSQPVSIGASTILKTRVLSAGSWSALAEAVFYTESDLSGLRITEVMYHPPPIGPIDEDEYEFIEFKNTADHALDLSGLRVDGGISFRFPFRERVEPRAFLILVSNLEAFAARYGDVEVLGEYDRHLGNGGESIRLTDFGGRSWVDLRYDDEEPWPAEADGGGFSLTRIDSPGCVDPSEPTCWMASTDFFGSPGRDDPRFRGGFIRGDSNGDREIDVSDPVHILLYLFLDASADSCDDARDVDDDGVINITDPVYLLRHMFQGGAPPPAPYPSAGDDLTADPLACERGQ